MLFPPHASFTLDEDGIILYTAHGLSISDLDWMQVEWIETGALCVRLPSVCDFTTVL